MAAIQSCAYSPSIQAAQRDILSNALNSHSFSDITFKIGGNDNETEYEINRFLLALLSPVLQSMLYGNMKESELNGDVIIDDMEPLVFECIIRFAYCQNPNITTENVLPLIKACDKYQIETLRKICCEFFRSVPNGENFCMFVYQATELKIMHLVGDILYEEISKHYAEWLNAQNIVDFFCFSHKHQLSNFVEIGYKFIESHAQTSATESNPFSQIFCSLCLKVMELDAFTDTFRACAQTYFVAKYKQCLNVDNFFSFYTEMSQRKLSVFQENCKLFLSESSESVSQRLLKSKEFQSSDLPTMRDMLLLPWKCGEEIIWECVLEWARHQSGVRIADSQDEEDSKNDCKAHENRLYLLKSVRDLIRFGLMDGSYFTEHVQSENILTDKDSVTILTFFVSPKNGCGSFSIQPRCDEQRDRLQAYTRVVRCNGTTGNWVDARVLQPFYERALEVRDIHLWAKLKHVKEMYYVHNDNVTVTIDDLKNEDCERWVEIPYEFLKSAISKLQKLNAIIGIEERRRDGTWPRAKGGDWKQTLQVGDIIDVKDCVGKWYEAVIRFTDSGFCIVHYIGWNVKYDERVAINDTARVAKRGTHTNGPHVPRKLKTQLK